MSTRDQRIRQMARALVDVLNDLVSKSAGVPRPIIGLRNAMPFFLPIRQRAVAALRALAEERREEFGPPTLVFAVHPSGDPASERTAQVAHPYTELAAGDIVETADDGSPVTLAEVTVTDVPAAWRSERPLDLIIRARSPHRRYGEAVAAAETINLRVPRAAIPGKDTGI